MCETCNINKRLAFKELATLAKKLQKAVTENNFMEIASNAEEKKFVTEMLIFLEERSQRYLGNI
jgi:hypothetical protein